MGKYKVEEEQFNQIKEKVEQYRSIGHTCKKVRCIETGQVFENAKMASRWVSEIRENYYCSIQIGNGSLNLTTKRQRRS